MRFPFFTALLACFPFFVQAHEIPVWWQPVSEYKGLPTERMYETVQAACNIITEKSLTPVSADEFAFAAIKSLSTIDQKVTASKDGKRVLILIDGKIMKSFSAPAENDCSNWSRLALAAAVEVRPYSKKVREADADEISTIFINAALGTIDSYSHYIMTDPVELEPLKKPAGLGISYRRIGRYLEITDIIPGGAASQTDLAIGDRISAIHGKIIPELSRVQVLNLLRGEAGTDAFLTLRRNGKEQNKTITRTPAVASPVTHYFDEKSKVMAIKISAFTEKTVSGLMTTLRDAFSKKAAGLIIDLRGNTGGLLKEAVLAADLFLPEGFLMIKTDGRHSDTKHQYISTEKKYRPVYPIVILIDKQTASSAEFFAGVLQEYRHAVVIGTPSYGKSVIQDNESLPGGGELYLSWAKYYLPSGFSPQGYGIYPNLCTSGKKMQDIDKMPAPISYIKPWTHGDEKEKKKGLALCPPESRATAPLDIEVARSLLLNRELYERSLTYFSLDSAVK